MKSDKLFYLILAIAPLYTMYHFANLGYERYVLNKNGREVIGVIAGELRGGETCSLRYKFAINQKVYTNDWPCDHFPINRIAGDSVSIVYLPRDPDVNAPWCDIFGDGCP